MSRQLGLDELFTKIEKIEKVMDLTVERIEKIHSQMDSLQSKFGSKFNDIASMSSMKKVHIR